MRNALLFSSLALAACGSPQTPSPPAVASSQAAPVPIPDAVSLPSLDTLAARGAVDAPLMRELTRVSQSAPRSPDVRADRDLCVRAVFAASGPARVSFADAAGTARGDVSSTGLAPAKGPACMTKGETLHLVVEAERGVVVRAVVFGAP